MNKAEIAGLFVAAMLILIALRVPLGAAMFVAGAGGYWWMVGDTVLLELSQGSAVGAVLGLRPLRHSAVSVDGAVRLGRWLFARSVSRRQQAGRALQRRRGAGRNHRLRLLRRHQRLVGRDRRDHVAGRAAGNEAAQLFGRSGDRHARRRRHAWNSGAAVDHPDRLCACCPSRASRNCSRRRSFPASSRRWAT